jgi:biopolymer transport protein ExbD
MAEINTASSGQKAGVRKGKRLSTRVDLTPMVDLGFLLITFFIFTTAISRPVAMKVYMPADGPETNTPATGALTVVPIENDMIFYYHGDLGEAVRNKLYGTASFDVKSGIGQIIRNKQLALVRSGKQKKDLVLIIKPTSNSTFRNSVDILDEVLINNIKHYAIVDSGDKDLDLLREMGIRL